MECWFEILYKNIIYVIGNFSTSNINKKETDF